MEAISGPAYTNRFNLFRAAQVDRHGHLVERGVKADRPVVQVPELELSVSATTRDPRNSERDGVHYHFMDDEEFELVMAGGLFRGRSRLLEGTLVDAVHQVAPLATPVHLGCKPVVGAVIQALELAGVQVVPGVRERLVASSNGAAATRSG